MLTALLFAAATTLAPGQLVEKVACADSPGMTYALYVPSTYKPERNWPIIFALDARGQALTPMSAFREAAEKYGYIIASSYDSASDGPMQPTIDAVRAMYVDTHKRLSIDDKRVYLAGFSGTVRIACAMGLAVPGSAAGVIGAGGGFPFDVKPASTTPFVFFGTTGTRDFNYDEMHELEEQLARVNVPHRLSVFDGTHEWMPAALASEALGWMSLRAMQSRTIPRDPALVDALWKADFERGRALEAGGALVDANRLYVSMLHDYAGLREIQDVVASVQRLNASPDLQRQKRKQEELRVENARYLDNAARILGASKLPSVDDLASALRLRDLDRRTHSSDADERFAAIRTQNTLLVQTRFYMPRAAREKGDAARAKTLTELASRIRPE